MKQDLRHSKLAMSQHSRTDISVQHSFRAPVEDCGILKERFRMWARRFTMVGYLLCAVGGWMLVKKPARSGFVSLALGATLQRIGGLLRHELSLPGDEYLSRWLMKYRRGCWIRAIFPPR